MPPPTPYPPPLRPARPPRYDQIKKMTPEQRKSVVPRVCIIGGKAAPGYEMAKRIIKLVRARACMHARVWSRGTHVGPWDACGAVGRMHRRGEGMSVSMQMVL